MARPLRICVCSLVGALCMFGQEANHTRRETLDLLLRVLPPSHVPTTGRLSAFENTWEEWVKRTGEEPPDFDNMPSIPDLPDPLILRENGRNVPVTNPDLWNRQKQWIRSQTERWMEAGGGAF